MKTDPYKKVTKIYDRLFEPMNSGIRAIGMKMYPPFEGMTVLHEMPQSVRLAVLDECKRALKEGGGG